MSQPSPKQMATLTPSGPSRWRETPSSEASASQRSSAPCYGLAEDVLVVPMVVGPFEFRHVERQIFRADVVERADDAAKLHFPNPAARGRVAPVGRFGLSISVE
jgi:hypothetical protein